MLSAVGIGVAPEKLQSIQDEPSETISGPITPPRVGAYHTTHVLSTRTRLLCLKRLLSGSPYLHCVGMWLGDRDGEAMQAEKVWLYWGQ